MDYKPMISKITDFLVNFAVASFAVSAYQGIWYGFVVGLLSLLGVILLSARLGGKR